jgi:CDP-Glycerol:Poly(glycerophosphate) glycerophosphotransferase
MIHHVVVDSPDGALGSLIEKLRARGITLARAQSASPLLDRAVRVGRRKLYERRFFGAGPRRRGTSEGRTFVIFNHCYDLDAEALCAADGPHTLWVLDPFQLFTDVGFYFPPEQRDLNCVYGEGAMRRSIDRFKAGFVHDFARKLRRETRLDALITPADTFYYLRPLIEELRALGVPTVVQDKEGTIAPGAMMEAHARTMAERYPPIADAMYFWNETVRDYWRRIGAREERMRVIGQPRSDFFFHPARWPTKRSLGLTEGKQLVVAFTYDADTYLRTTEALPERPWKPLRDDLHGALFKLARERPELEIVIKAHPQQIELEEIADELARSAPSNVRLMAGASSASHLLVRADVVVGFQSTVMIEAMLTSKPVIYAGWGAAHESHSNALVPIHRSGGCALATSRSDLDRMLRAAVDGELTPGSDEQRARRAFTNRYFFGADGRVSERVLAAAAELVASQRASR